MFKISNKIIGMFLLFWGLTILYLSNLEEYTAPWPGAFLTFLLLINSFSKNKTYFFDPLYTLLIFTMIFWWIPSLIHYYYYPDSEYNYNYNELSLSYLMIISGLYYIFIDIKSDSSIFKYKSTFNLPFTKSVFYISGFFCILSLSLFYLKSGGVPIISENPESSRVRALTSGGGYFFRLSYINLYFFSISSAILIAHKKIKKKPTIILFLILILGVLSCGPRREALASIVIFILVFNYASHGKIRFSTFIYSSILVFLVFLIFGTIRNTGHENIDLERGTFLFINRFIVEIVNAGRIFYLVIHEGLDVNPLIHEVKILLPGHQPDLGTFLKEKLNLNWQGGGITTPYSAEIIMFGKYSGILIIFLTFSLLSLLRYFSKFHHRWGIFIIPISFILISVYPTMGISAIIIKNIIPLSFVTLKIYLTHTIVRSLKNE